MKIRRVMLSSLKDVAMPVVLNQVNCLVDLMSRSSQHGETHWSANAKIRQL